MIRLPYNPPEEVDGWSVNIGQNNNTKLIRLRIMDSELQSFLLQFPYEGLWDEESEESEESEDDDGHYQSEEEDDEPTEGEIIFEEHDEAQH